MPRPAGRLSTTPRLLALASGKGGTAKSSLALALSHTLAGEQGRAVVLLDLDPQAGATDYAGLEPAADPLQAEPIEAHGVRIFRGGRPLGAASVSQVAAHITRAVAAAGPEGLVVVDLSPAWGDTAHAALLERPDVLLVLAVKLDGGGLTALRELTALAESRGLPFRIVPTFGKRWSISQGVLRSLRGFYAEHVTSAVVPEDVRAAEATTEGQPVTLYAPRSRVAEAVRDLAEQLVGAPVGVGQ